MSERRTSENNTYARWVMTCVRIPLFLLCFLLLLTSAGLAQDPDDGFSIELPNACAANAGEILRLPVSTIQPVDIGAFFKAQVSHIQ